MKQGDFTELARDYKNRPGYSDSSIQELMRYVNSDRKGFSVVDVGAGTGKFTEHLAKAGLTVRAVEPNDAMRSEGIEATKNLSITWSKGSAEATNLESNSADWVTMASSFHWTDKANALKEFHRILRPGGFFTALWNPRDIEKSPLLQTIERIISELAPNINRVSSGSKKFTATLNEDLVSTGHFTNVMFLETPFTVTMSRDRFLGAWRSVNDVQAQAGPDVWNKIIQAIELETASMNEIVVPYLTRSWTVTRVERQSP